MREIEKTKEEKFDKRRLAEMAGASVDAGTDSYSDYRVGATVAIEFRDTEDEFMGCSAYCGSNINLSGMEIKIHAEQLALFQAILDMEEHGLSSYAVLDEVMVVTSEDDLALRCGHCLQVFAGACDHYGWDESEVGYSAARGNTLYDDRGNPDGVHYDYDENILAELIGDTYVSNRG